MAALKLENIREKSVEDRERKTPMTRAAVRRFATWSGIPRVTFSAGAPRHYMPGWESVKSLLLEDAQEYTIAVLGRLREVVKERREGGPAGCATLSEIRQVVGELGGPDSDDDAA
jgi:hypothetical protein